jgi:general secretion pathway protein H
MWAAGDTPLKRNFTRGFTLLELLAALAIAALVLGVSAPASMRLYSSVQYSGAVKDVMTLLTSARYAAVSKGKNQDVMIKPGSRELKLNGKTRQLPESIEIEVVSARELNRQGGGVIRFYPDGGSTGGVVRLQHERGMGSEVQVGWLLGRIELCKKDCGKTSGL